MGPPQLPLKACTSHCFHQKPSPPCRYLSCTNGSRQQLMAVQCIEPVRDFYRPGLLGPDQIFSSANLQLSLVYWLALCDKVFHWGHSSSPSPPRQYASIEAVVRLSQACQLQPVRQQSTNSLQHTTVESTMTIPLRRQACDSNIQDAWSGASVRSGPILTEATPRYEAFKRPLFERQSPYQHEISML